MTEHSTTELAATLMETLKSRSAKIAIVGLGYVGLPLAFAAHKAGFRVIGLDVDEQKVNLINAGSSPIRSVTPERVQALARSDRFHATTNFDELREVNAVIICVPTPLSPHRDPDLTFIRKTGESICPRLRKGQLVVLESTTYPGTTEEFLKPLLEQSGLKAGVDFFLAYSPEREDPGNLNFETATIPRVVGADDP